MRVANVWGQNLIGSVYCGGMGGGGGGGGGSMIDIMDDSFQGSSIAALRRKALEHTVTMGGMVVYR